MTEYLGGFEMARQCDEKLDAPVRVKIAAITEGNFVFTALSEEKDNGQMKCCWANGKDMRRVREKIIL